MSERLTAADSAAVAGLAQWFGLTLVLYLVAGTTLVRSLVGPGPSSGSLSAWHVAIYLSLSGLGCLWNAARLPLRSVWLRRCLHWAALSCWVAAAIVALDPIGPGDPRTMLRPTSALLLILGGLGAWAVSGRTRHRDLRTFWILLGVGSAWVGLDKLLGIHHTLARTVLHDAHAKSAILVAYGIIGVAALCPYVSRLDGSWIHPGRYSWKCLAVCVGLWVLSGSIDLVALGRGRLAAIEETLELLAGLGLLVAIAMEYEQTRPRPAAARRAPTRASMGV